MPDARTIAQVLGFRRSGSCWVGRCPAHEDRNPSCTIRDGDTAPIFKCHAGCTSAEIVSAPAVRAILGTATVVDEEEVERRRRERERERIAHDKRRINQALDIWRGTVVPGGTPTEAYLRSRAIEGVIPPSVRHHADCYCADTGGGLPAMMSVVKRGDAIVAVHRTYLSGDGRKADVPTVKSTLGPLRGGAVRLTKPADTLILAEGIETALSVRGALQGRDVAVWSALSAPNLAAVEIPNWAKEIVVAADNDSPGRRAAEAVAIKCRERGIDCRLMLPPEPFKDWNDVAMAEAGQ